MSYRYERVDNKDEVQLSNMSESGAVSSQPPAAPAPQNPAPVPPASQSYVQPHVLAMPPPVISDQYEYTIRHGHIFDSAVKIFKWKACSFMTVGLLAIVSLVAVSLVKSFILNPNKWNADDIYDEEFSGSRGRHGFWWLFVSGLFDLLMGLVVTLWLSGTTAATLEYMRGRRAGDFSETFCSGFHYYFRPVVKAYLLQQILITIGLWLFIVPGLYLMVAFIYVQPLCIDRPYLPAVAHLRLSLRMVNKNLCGTLSLVVFMVLVCLGGLLCCGVGIFPAVLIVHIMCVTAYRDVFGCDPSALGNVPVQAEPELGPGAGVAPPSFSFNVPVPPAGGAPVAMPPASLYPSQASRAMQAAPLPTGVSDLELQRAPVPSPFVYGGARQNTFAPRNPSMPAPSFPSSAAPAPAPISDSASTNYAPSARQLPPQLLNRRPVSLPFPSANPNPNANSNPAMFTGTMAQIPRAGSVTPGQ
eukprot:TRINITY_DN2762_c0_g1_i6.p1 TRINITY_DN2762_c0_g1~~TRINITY_DN2762_c0_g1_i6.p1  ORF type:complete len:471 (-),score=159.06 TRINITY_DN2762_c0_g1_i6:274-1686(-)